MSGVRIASEHGRGSSGCGKVQGRDLEFRTARMAALVTRVPLKDRLAFHLDTVRAQEVRGLIVATGIAAGLAQAIYDRTGRCFPKFIALKLFFKVLRLNEAVMQRRNLHVQVGVRNLRIRYLKARIGHRGYNIGISTKLRRLEKNLEGFPASGKSGDGVGGFRDHFQGAVDDIEGVFHRVLQSDKSRASLKDILQPSGADGSADRHDAGTEDVRCVNAEKRPGQVLSMSRKPLEKLTGVAADGPGTVPDGKSRSI